MNKIILQPGDIVLEDHHSKNKFIDFFLNIQDWFDKGLFNHAMIGFDHNVCLEAGFQNVRFRRINTADPRFTVLRYKEKYDIELMKALIEKYAAEHDGYSYSGLVSAAISTMYWRLTGQKKQFFPDNKKPYCAELVAEIWEEFGLKLDINENIITPNDLYRSSLFEVVKIGYY